MKNFVQPGNYVTVTAPADGIASGDGVLVGHLFGVATTTAKEGQECEIATNGVYDLAKDTGEALTAGAPVYWNASAGKATATATDNLRIGTAVLAAATAATTGRVLITGHAI